MRERVYLMRRILVSDGTLIRRKSHRLLSFKTGLPLDSDFDGGPITFKLDSDLRLGTLPTFFARPALVARREFEDTLRAIGVDNIETCDALIEDQVDGRVIGGYRFVNIIGLVACADMSRSESESLGEEMTVIDRLVLRQSALRGLDLFVVAEDTDNIVISERVRRHLASFNFPDIAFDEIETV